MHIFRSLRIGFVVIAVLTLIVLTSNLTVNAQSRPQKQERPTGDGKKNERPRPLTEEEKKKAEEAKRLAEEEKNAIVDDTVERVETNLVNVDSVVYHKRSGEIIGGLKRGNFAIYENGVKQEIVSFSEPESPITVTLVVEYSKWSEIFGRASGGIWEPGTYEVIRPVAYFLSNFIKPPNDYASVIAFDMRPTPITDFTNDAGRLRNSVELLLRNRPAFRENNLWDALSLALIGGRADSVVLERSENEKSEYGGMVDVKSKRRAIILVASGIDTFSRINYGEMRRIVQEAGIPIYIISTGNMFYKRYEAFLGPMDGLDGSPGRLTFLQAQNAMNTIAKESGGRHFPMTFESEVPGHIQNINALLRSQYSLAYELPEKREPGKKYKIEVKVDVDGDGVYDDKAYDVQHRPFYSLPKEDKKK